ncbi:Hypothetical protein NTJ_09107 [Nesidiocoris tenuis]|uniref:Uncharacterized protein n=1 Tax=Nesidiocoris tenuis TaxID=355587 RepID=A0ABN7AVV0_9HEMI|nr:Hypothetical protein NTJ_09107 [Nesidiocoris tenuis]
MKPLTEILGKAHDLRHLAQVSPETGGVRFFTASSWDRDVVPAERKVRKILKPTGSHIVAYPRNSTCR